ncbi:MAG: hypothetical protein KGJ77_10140 [Acidobacteriota bacterium]|nr:hypothetical protein [Acidobacteriota bacterium]
MAILASLFGAVAALSAAHVVLARLRWIEWDNRAANSHPVLDPRPPEGHHPELTELARRNDLDVPDETPGALRLSPFAQAAGWRPRHPRGDGRGRTPAVSGR